MQEIRCRKCQQLLGRYRSCTELEVKCCRCGYYTRVGSVPERGLHRQNTNMMALKPALER